MAIENKVKLNVTTVSEPKEVGTKGAKKLSFKATAADGKEYSYQSFSTRLFDYIKTGAAIEADVDTSSHEYENNIYTDRKVTQIYVNGQPVMAANTGTGKGGNYNRNQLTPEQWAEKDRIERASIEAQTAYKGIMEMASQVPADVSVKFDKAFDRALDWAMEKLGGTTVKPSAPSAKPAPEPAPQAPKPKSDADADWDQIKSGSEVKVPATSDERLDKAMKDGGYNAGQIKTHVYAKYGVTDWKKLNVGQYNELLLAVQNCQIKK